MTNILTAGPKVPKLISFVIPVFNEEESLLPFVDGLRATLTKIPHDYELIFVDDGSRDSSWEKLGELVKSDSRIRALSLSRNFGSHSAITAGLFHARGDATIILAADLQDPPDVVLQFIEKWEKGFEVVWGVRKRRKDSGIKKFLSALFYRLLRALALPEYPAEGTGSFCLIDKKVRESLREFGEKNRVVFGLISWAGFKQDRVFYDREGRSHGKSKWSLGKMFKTGIDAFTAYSYIPLRLSTYAGVFFLFISLSVILFVTVDWFVRRNVLKGWTTLMISIYFLGGTQLLFLGIIGEYLWRISQDVKGRPLFIVREQIGFPSNSWNETLLPNQRP